MAEFGDPLSFAVAGADAEVNVEMLDYDYVKDCKDVKILKSIVNVLKSGKEGIYPEVKHVPCLLIYLLMLFASRNINCSCKRQLKKNSYPCYPQRKGTKY